MFCRSIYLLRLLPFCSIHPIFTKAALVNYTIDDESPDTRTGTTKWSYTPNSGPSVLWSFGPECTGCYDQLDTTQVLDGSWHDNTFSHNDSTETVPHNASVDFVGKPFTILLIRIGYYVPSNTNNFNSILQDRRSIFMAFYHLQGTSIRSTCSICFSSLMVKRLARSIGAHPVIKPITYTIPYFTATHQYQMGRIRL